jgi:pSer/pThr/pTyr-binding forkhead associated (FHA) protein
MKILTIGRDGTDIVLRDKSKEVSRLHAELTITDDGSYYLVDCGSSNGTSVRVENGWKRIKQEFVKADDQIRFGGNYTTSIRELLGEPSPAAGTRMR